MAYILETYSSNSVKTIGGCQDIIAIVDIKYGSVFYLDKEMATLSGIFAWRIPWSEEPGVLWSMGLQRIKHDRAANTHTVSSTKNIILKQDGS